MLTPSPVAARVEAVTAALLAQQGYEVVLIEHLPGPGILRLYIDRVAQTATADVAPLGPITLEDCAKVSRVVSDVLDGEGVMEGEAQGRYSLEVSSPGLDRPLTRPAHFIRFIGETVRLRCRANVPGVVHRRVDGTLSAANDDGIEVVQDGITLVLSYADVDRAHLVPQF